MRIKFMKWAEVMNGRITFGPIFANQTSEVSWNYYRGGKEEHTFRTEIGERAYIHSMIYPEVHYDGQDY